MAGTIEANDMRYRCGVATRTECSICPVENSAATLMRYATQAVRRKATTLLNVDHKKLPKSQVKTWILDSGVACDIICRLSLQYLVPHKPKQIANFHTANGMVRCIEMVTISVDHLQEAVGAYVLDESPDLLSLGIRCLQLGYAFHWEPFSTTPTLVTPDGRVL